MNPDSALLANLNKSSFAKGIRFNGNQGRNVVHSRLLTNKIERLNYITNNSEYSLFTILLSAIQFLLYKYNGNVSVLSWIPGLKTMQIKNSGNLILPIVNRFQGEMKLKEVLLNFKEELNQTEWGLKNLNDKAFEYYKNKEWYSNLIFLEGIHKTENINPEDFEISFGFKLDKDALSCHTNYDLNLFDLEQINRIIIYIERYLTQLIDDSSISLSKIEILALPEKTKLIDEFNNTHSEMTDISIIHLFEKQAGLFPWKIALQQNNLFLTYSELNKKINLLADLIQEKCELEDNIIAILAEPSIDAITGMFAILKAGGIFLPISYKTPARRIKYILKDSGSGLILTHKRLHKLIDQNIETIFLDNIERKPLKGGSSHTTIDKINKFGYVMYTSGSTGNPKGVLIKHDSLLNLCKWYINSFLVTEKERTAKYADLSFDASILEIFPYLISGASIHLLDNVQNLSIEELRMYFITHDINYTFLPTGICEQFISKPCNSLKKLFTGGDNLKSFTNQAYEVINIYGLTELCVASTSYAVKNDYNEISIGVPIYNTEIYILDTNLQLQPIGVTGEIYVGGIGLTEGYINQPELTSKTLVTNPFNAEKKIFKTGDLGYWLPDGHIQFLGRKDNQVKVRGFRIETEEIENKLQQYEGIIKAIVIAKPIKSVKILCAYYISEKTIENEKLKKFLSSELPEYMVPSFFIKIDNIPLTINGKVDTRQLLEISLIKEDNIVGPTSKVQKRITKIWQELLEIEKVGITQNFFDLGGNSVLILKMISKFETEFNLKMSSTLLFNYPTIASLSEYFEQKLGNKKEDENKLVSTEIKDAKSRIKRIKRNIAE